MAAANAHPLEIERRGLPTRAERYDGPRFLSVDEDIAPLPSQDGWRNLFFSELRSVHVATRVKGVFEHSRKDADCSVGFFLDEGFETLDNIVFADARSTSEEDLHRRKKDARSPGVRATSSLFSLGRIRGSQGSFCSNVVGGGPSPRWP